MRRIIDNILLGRNNCRLRRQREHLRTWPSQSACGKARTYEGLIRQPLASPACRNSVNSKDDLAGHYRQMSVYWTTAALTPSIPPARPENISIYSGASINFSDVCGTARGGAWWSYVTSSVSARARLHKTVGRQMSARCSRRPPWARDTP